MNERESQQKERNRRLVCQACRVIDGVITTGLNDAFVTETLGWLARKMDEKDELETPEGLYHKWWD